MSYLFNLRRQKSRRKRLRSNMTRAEIVLWYSLKGKQLLGCKFRRQHGVDQYILDFYCPELMLAIEVDGETHNSEEARQRDRKRQEAIELYGIRFLRFTDDEVLGNPDRVVEAIEEKGEATRSLGQEFPAPLFLEGGSTTLPSRRLVEDQGVVGLPPRAALIPPSGFRIAIFIPRSDFRVSRFLLLFLPPIFCKFLSLLKGKPNVGDRNPKRDCSR